MIAALVKNDLVPVMGKRKGARLKVQLFGTMEQSNRVQLVPVSNNFDWSDIAGFFILELVNILLS